MCVSLEAESPSTVMLERISSEWNSLTFKETMPLEPVYVEKIGGEENLVYNSNMLKLGKQYPVTWNDEHLVLIKNKSSVDIYKFYPDQ